MAFLFDLHKANLSYYAVPAAFFIAFSPSMYAGALIGPKYNNAQPRKNLDMVAKDESISKQTRYRIERAKAASANGFETMAMFAAGVIAANQAGVSRYSLNVLSLSYLATRIAYNFIYVVLQDNNRWASVRSLVWMASVGQIFTLFIKAGNALN